MAMKFRAHDTFFIRKGWLRDVYKRQAGNREDAIVRNKSGRKIKYKINRRPSQLKKLSKSGQYAAKKAEHLSLIHIYLITMFLNAAITQKPLALSKEEFRGITYVREIAEQTLQAVNLPGDVYKRQAQSS